MCDCLALRLGIWHLLTPKDPSSGRNWVHFIDVQQIVLSEESIQSHPGLRSREGQDMLGMHGDPETSRGQGYGRCNSKS